jgi:carboxyl-terminal processing protease
MRKLFHRLIILFILILVIIISCKKEEPVIEPDPNEIEEANDVNKFIWDSLAYWYYWADEVDNLSNPDFYKYPDSLNAFLNNYSDPVELFYSMLYKYGEVDKYWSFIVDDVKEIEDWISGIDESMGFEFKYGNIKDFNPNYKGNSSDIFVVVMYVLKDSPADRAGLKRGDFFTKVDDIQLTESNWQNFLYDKKSYTLTMADMDANYVITENGNKYSMTAEIIQENPVYMDTILNVDGLKVGYLVYNGFTSAYDEKLGTSYDLLLNDVFTDFKTENIDKLVLDLRYNGGGSVLTALYLASMIYSTNYNLTFARTKYNDRQQEYYRNIHGDDYFILPFLNYIYKEEWKFYDDNGNLQNTIETPRTPISSLGLNENELYVITSNWTASASELLINGLEPYINVTTVGTNTIGKNVGSGTFRYKDDPDHTDSDKNWAMQIIILKIANSENYSEYINGLPPDITTQEDIKNLLPFGDTNETLLKSALNDIEGQKSSLITDSYYKPSLKFSKKRSRLNQEMYFQPELLH